MDASRLSDTDDAILPGADDAPNENDGNAFDGSAIDAGQSCDGLALRLDGVTYGAATNPVANDFTLEAWINTTFSQPGTNFWEGRGVLYADAFGPANDFGTSILSDPADGGGGGGKFAFGVGTPDVTIVSASTVANGRWTHVAAVRRESTGEIQVLVNGILEATAFSGDFAPLSASMSLAIGSNTTAGGFFVGLIDEVRVWNVVRSPAEITSTMHRRLTGNEPGLVAYYRFDEPRAGTALDSGPNHFDAALLGAPVWVPSDVTCYP